MIEILLFAHLREQVGQGKLVIDNKQLKVAELRELLETKYSLQTQGVMVAINEELSTNEDIIQAGDVVALIPPVSGG